MSQCDRTRWDEKYRGKRVGEPHPSFLEQLTRFPMKGRVLEIACGTGAHALHLAGSGAQVDALDGSGVALRALHEEACKRGLRDRVQPIVADIDAIPFQGPGAYQGILVWSFLDRALLKDLPDLLAPGGTLLFSTFHRGYLEERPSFRTEWMLGRDEGSQLFPKLDLVHFESDETRSVIVARKT